MVHLVKFPFDIFQARLILNPLLSGLVLDLSRFLDTRYDRTPRRLQRFDLNGTAGRQLRCIFGLLDGIACIFDKQLIRLLVKAQTSLLPAHAVFST